MADGDIFRKLQRVYIKSYKGLCEGKATIAECAQSIMTALKQDIKIKGDLPIILAQKMGEMLTQILSEVSASASVDWGSVNKEIEKIVQQVDGLYHVKELILRAGKQFIQEIRHGYSEEINVSSTSEVILGNYMNEVYESGFKGCILLTDNHHAGIDGVVLEGKIKEIQPEVRSVISNWAKKAITDRGVDKLRLPRRRQVTAIDMDGDLC
ncbi:hypothetical protein HCU40_17230 [Pseudanabaena biceps]|nr:hypothetical protein [Pseudanabaena biceps]